MSVVTFYAVGPKTMNCCSQNERGSESQKLGISKIASVANMILSIISYGITFGIIYYIYEANKIVNYGYWMIILLASIPLLAISIIFFVISLVLDLDCCCAQSQKCLCSCCCGPGCFKFKYEYIKISRENNVIEILKSD